MMTKSEWSSAATGASARSLSLQRCSSATKEVCTERFLLRFGPMWLGRIWRSEEKVRPWLPLWRPPLLAASDAGWEGSSVES